MTQTRAEHDAYCSSGLRSQPTRLTYLTEQLSRLCFAEICIHCCHYTYIMLILSISGCYGRSDSSVCKIGKNFFRYWEIYQGDEKGSLPDYWE